MHVLSKGKAKFIRSLQHQKYRQKYHKIIVEGVKILNELITSRVVEIEEIYASEEWHLTHDELLDRQTERILVSRDELATISSLKNPQDCLAVVSMPERVASMNAPSAHLCLYLDAVRDPGNLGTLLRSADWFGYKNVFLSPDCVDIYNPKVIQSSMASIFRTHHMYIDLPELIESNNEIPVYGAILGAEEFTPSIVNRSGLIVLGNESKGIRNDYEGLITHPFSISSAYSLGAESLNVGVAGGIICSMFRAI
jgi:TrmH family RNA methyltransferase